MRIETLNWFVGVHNAAKTVLSGYKLDFLGVVSTTDEKQPVLFVRYWANGIHTIRIDPKGNFHMEDMCRQIAEQVSEGGE